MNALEGSVDHGFEFVSVFDLAALSETPLGFFGIQPDGFAIFFVGASGLMDLHQKSLDHEQRSVLDAARP
jgi:hypothetical protein